MEEDRVWLLLQQLLQKLLHQLAKTTCAILSQEEVSSRASAPSSSSAAQGIAMPVVENSAVRRTILQVLRSTDEACKPIVAELEQLLTVLETPGFEVLQHLGLLFKIKSLLQQISEIKPFWPHRVSFWRRLPMPWSKRCPIRAS